MKYHGLTDRFPKVLYLTTPDDKAWRTQADARMAADLGERLSAYLQTITKIMHTKEHHIKLKNIRKKTIKNIKNNKKKL